MQPAHTVLAHVAAPNWQALYRQPCQSWCQSRHTLANVALSSVYIQDQDREVVYFGITLLVLSSRIVLHCESFLVVWAMMSADRGNVTQRSDQSSSDAFDLSLKQIQFA
jgi:hypothetical protein